MVHVSKLKLPRKINYYYSNHRYKNLQTNFLTLIPTKVLNIAETFISLTDLVKH